MRMIQAKHSFDSALKAAASYGAAVLLSVTGLLLSLPANALEQADASDIPHVGERARNHFANYIYSPSHKAFAIGPGGYWAWSNGMASEEQASRQAIKDCESNNAGQRCLVYALNDDIVFDERMWTTLWRPYSTAKSAAAASVGSKRGMRFYNLRFRDSRKRLKKISDYRGKAVIVHFWGSWCPPCLGELPELRKFYRNMNKTLKGKAELIMLQVREPITYSRRWLKQNELAGLPLFDSGMKSKDDSEIVLADGTRLPDRQIAFVFPTTYVLDRNGVVVFSRFGPIHDWSEYQGLLRDVAGR